MDRMIRKLMKEDLREIYLHMEQDFPANERKPLRLIEESFDTGFMEGYGFFRTEQETSVLLAYALFVSIRDVLLFDYYAVIPECREKGVGSYFLNELKEKLADKECVIGEVENPDYCEDPDERRVMERRIDFYLRNGLRDTGASGKVYGVEYRFLEMELGGTHSKEEAEERIGRFYHAYWKDEEEFRKYVTLHT